MNCEVEFLAVGEASCAGDAIVIRYGDEYDYRLMLVDGGHAATGAEIVRHLRAEFGPDARLEHVVLTHSDADHASGLRAVLEEIPVGNLWLHIPWIEAEKARHLFKNKPFTEEGLRNRIKGEYDIISEIVDIAFERRIPMFPPFAGTQIGPFRVCSPTSEAYQYLLPQFEKTPDPDQAAIEAAGMWIGKASAIDRALRTLLAGIQKWTEESWFGERLRDGGKTSASNESSVVLYGDFGDTRRVLLTGDAGVEALQWAAQNAEFMGLPLQQFSFVQIPHHGSRRNVGPSVLNRLIGPIQSPDHPKRFTAFVSAPKDDATHPRTIVINAFIRRGGRVIATQGQNKVHYGGFMPRPGYDAVTPMAFSSVVEDYD